MGLSKDCYAESKQMCLTNANSFSYAAKFLNEEKRNAAYALYGFCRYTDNILDDLSTKEEKINQLNEWKKELAEGWKNNHSNNSIIHAFVHTCKEYHIPQEMGFALISMLEKDLDLQTVSNFEQLKEYCYGAGGIPGIFMASVCHTSKEALPYAVDLGIAMQLTNILRDIKEDYLQGRIYLPQDELQQFGITQEHFQQGKVDPSFVQFMQYQITRARKYYSNAENGIKFLQESDRLPMRLCLLFYREILSEIEKQHYDVFSQRIFVPLKRKEELVALAQAQTVTATL